MTERRKENQEGWPPHKQEKMVLRRGRSRAGCFLGKRDVKVSSESAHEGDTDGLNKSNFAGFKGVQAWLSFLQSE